MRHDWVLDVLSDLHAYACRNELPRLAEKVELALIEANSELAAAANANPNPILTFRARRREH